MAPSAKRRNGAAHGRNGTADGSNGSAGGRNGSADGRNGAAKRRKGKGGRRSGGGSRSKVTRRPDPSDTPDSEVRFVQPYEATKSYLCPGCNGDIPPGMGHMVAVPPDAPDLRRHWHRGCWNNRASRY